jgi:1-aminocyclopropane-1-carboxylate deaminase/D-cysteine desulfhydrase-like pyridoxal-dependent ACC family enzyme
MIVQNTPIETYSHKGIKYFVKREDLSCTLPGPPSAKMRGLSLFLKNLKQKGVKEVGYMDTAISMAGWGISYFAKITGLKAVLYCPKYKDGYRYNQAEFIAKWGLFGAEIVPLEHPAQHQINIHRAKRDFLLKYPDGVWLPNGLKFSETISAVKQEMQETISNVHPKSIICSVGSGVMISGILQGLNQYPHKVEQIFGVLVTQGIESKKKKLEVLNLAGFIEKQAGLFFQKPNIHDIVSRFEIIESNYNYHDDPQIESSFPCNNYYDLKAFEWMLQNIKQLKQPILFWNIGA